MSTSPIPPFLSLILSTLAVSLIGCGPPQRGEAPQPWGGLDDGVGDDAADGTDAGDDSQDAGDAGDADGDDSADDGGSGDTGGDGSDGGPDPSDSGESGEPDGPPESPYTGGWDIGTCQDDIVPTGTGVGQIAPDFLLFDQFGDQVRLYDFCHKAVYIIAGAFW